MICIEKGNYKVLCECDFHACLLDTPINNERYISLRFDVKESYVLHGFAGYFDTVLYDDITLSKSV